MIRLRKYDRKMLKVAAVLSSCILILLGLILVDVVRGVPTSGPALQSSHKIKTDRKADHIAGTFGLVNVDFKQQGGNNQMYFADGSDMNLMATVADVTDVSANNSDVFVPENDGKTGSSIPEPSTLGIAAVGAMLLLTTRHRKVRLLAAA